MKPSTVALSAGVLPIVCVHLCYIVAASYGHVPWCIPYWESCTSISATGRHPPEFFIFKLLMIPTALLMMHYWALTKQWLFELNSTQASHLTVIHVLGVLAGLALILYTAALGIVGDAFQTVRRIGITLFFGFTAFSHILVVKQLSSYCAPHSASPIKAVYYWQLGLSTLLVLGGTANGILNLLYERFNEINDAIEWSFAIVMILQFIVSYFAWKHTGFQHK
ncbi:Frag1/DRAM/Sfk1 family protein [Alkalimarinus coralli]|uniref:Frag1/DRAM/Sfk1 family protein n=1 Tax=Alkalimarinus coralli TaxID=2935863 RepID=UPI00202ADEF6|nr:Frag1/DRAM/Sfk1 family protein [Alkalimarinus coralli]